MSGNGKRQDVGGSRIVVYLADVTEQDVDELADKVVSLCVEEGFTNPPVSEEAQVACVVTIEPYEWPETAEEFIAEAGESASAMIVPT